MMGMTMPTQSSLTDLMTLLQLLQAASDPATAKQTIETISAARKQYDDAIADAQTRLTAANEAERLANAAAIASEQAAEKAQKKRAAMEEKLAGLDAQAAALDNDRRLLEETKAEVQKMAADLAAERKSNAVALSAAMADLAKKSVALDDRAEILNQKIGDANALKAEFEEKLAKFKALTQ